MLSYAYHCGRRPKGDGFDAPVPFASEEEEEEEIEEEEEVDEEGNPIMSERKTYASVEEEKIILE